MLLYLTLAVLVAIALAEAAIIRHLAIDPGFGIKTRAAGELAMWLTLRRKDVIYGDIDHLGLVNAALTTAEHAGHDRFNQLMQGVIRGLRGADVALVYGGDEIRLLVASSTGLGAARRFQELLRAAPLSAAERAALRAATGKDHISVTLAVARHCRPRQGLDRAKLAVAQAKPKHAIGLRGAILEV